MSDQESALLTSTGESYEEAFVKCCYQFIIYLFITVRLTGQQAGYFKGFLIKVVTDQGEAVGVMTAPRGYMTVQCGPNVSSTFRSIITGECKLRPKIEI